MQIIYEAIPPELWRYLVRVPFVWWINAAFVLWTFICLWAIYYGTRRYLGHERFKGQWYNARQLQALKQELYSGVREGRLPDSQMMAFLDRHIYGKKNALRSINGNGWL